MDDPGGRHHDLDAEVVDATTHVLRTLRTLEMLAGGSVRVGELVDRLGVHRRTARRLLGRLVTEGYALRVRDSDEYDATFKLLGVAYRALHRSDLAKIASPYITQLRDLTGESAHLTVPTGTGAMHVIEEPGEKAVTVRTTPGDQVPYHSTAVGKILLAYLPEKMQQLGTDAQLPRCSPKTIIDRADLLIELAKSRQRGYAIDDQENDVDLRCVAAPVFDHSGIAVAALGISAPASRLSLEGCATVGAQVSKTALALSKNLGFEQTARAQVAEKRELRSLSTAHEEATHHVRKAGAMR